MRSRRQLICGLERHEASNQLPDDDRAPQTKSLPVDDVIIGIGCIAGRATRLPQHRRATHLPCHCHQLRSRCLGDGKPVRQHMWPSTAVKSIHSPIFLPLPHLASSSETISSVSSLANGRQTVYCILH